MGGIEAKMMEDFAENDSGTKPKNWEYYNGTRFFKVGRSNYPQYIHGFWYGYYKDDEYYEKILYESEREF